jgi:anthranilate synthase/aminodeoxychorismate synthase-like glutamine amidotransferase
MVPWLRTRPSVPVLGVCLGHQALAVAAGGALGVLPQPFHGRASGLRTTDVALFRGLPAPLPAARYHSLFVQEVPEAFVPIAWTRHGELELCMAMRHRQLPHLGLQFHPESILTPYGSTLLERVLAEALRGTP